MRMAAAAPRTRCQAISSGMNGWCLGPGIAGLQVDEPLARVDSESVAPDQLVVDLYFEFCITWNQASSGRLWAQAECPP